MGFIIFLHLAHGERGTKQDTTRQELTVRKIPGLAKKIYMFWLFPIEVQKSTTSNVWEKAVCFVRACRGSKRAAPSSKIFTGKSTNR
jgi:hypothetical protein